MPHKDPDIAKLYFKNYYREHRDEKLEYHKQWRAKNREKCNAANRRWNKKNPEKRKQIARESYHRRKEQYVAYRRHYRTGCDLDTYTARWNEQGGRCAICGSPPFKAHLDADHDHKTGKVRGLLCNRCNTALGNFQEDVEILRKASSYLEKWR